MDALLAPFLVGGKQHFGVGVGPERVAERFELATQLDVVEDFAVVKQLERTVGARERLAPAVGQIDDREARVTERDAFGGHELAHTVGPAML